MQANLAVARAISLVNRRSTSMTKIVALAGDGIPEIMEAASLLAAKRDK